MYPGPIAAAVVRPSPQRIPPSPSAPMVMDHHERMRLRNAAFYARKAYPGPVGELICREILVYEDFGYRLGGDAAVLRLVDAVLATPLPE